jgi:hypothetical protein
VEPPIFIRPGVRNVEIVEIHGMSIELEAFRILVGTQPFGILGLSQTGDDDPQGSIRDVIPMCIRLVSFSWSFKC